MTEDLLLAAEVMQTAEPVWTTTVFNSTGQGEQVAAWYRAHQGRRGVGGQVRHDIDERPGVAVCVSCCERLLIRRQK
jgi:hypothetical protein